VNFSVHYNIHYITFTILVSETWNNYNIFIHKFVLCLPSVEMLAWGEARGLGSCWVGAWGEEMRKA
jgi:hypothetical protein